MMQRYLPFAIIIAVAVLVVGASAMLYRAKMRVASAAAAPARSADAKSGNGAPLAAIATPETGPEHVRGAAGAPVTLEVFGDFQCPSCATVTFVISNLEQVNGPRLRVVFREFPLEMHAHALEAALAAEAAGLQGRFWEMHDMLYQYQEVWSKMSNATRLFEIYAGNLGLDVERFRTDSQSDAVRARVISEGEMGVSRGVKNTPTLFINDNMFRGAFTQERVQAAIDAALAGKKNP